GPSATRSGTFPPGAKAASSTPAQQSRCSRNRRPRARHPPTRHQGDPSATPAEGAGRSSTPTPVPAHLTPRRLADACAGVRERRRVTARDSDPVPPVPLAGPPVQHHLHPADLLAVGLKSAPDDVALLSNRRRVTWRELDDESRLLAAGYRQFGLSPGDRVASLMPNCIDLVVHYLACLRAGLVATPLNYRYTHREIDHALDVCGASALLAHAERRADVEASSLASELPLDVISYAGAGETARFEELVSGPEPDVEIGDVAPSSPAVI